jgi:hypothetical protein
MLHFNVNFSKFPLSMCFETGPGFVSPHYPIILHSFSHLILNITLILHLPLGTRMFHGIFASSAENENFRQSFRIYYKEKYLRGFDRSDRYSRFGRIGVRLHVADPNKIISVTWVRIPSPSPYKVKTPLGEGLKTTPEAIKR